MQNIDKKESDLREELASAIRLSQALDAVMKKKNIVPESCQVTENFKIIDSHRAVLRQ